MKRKRKRNKQNPKGPWLTVAQMAEYLALTPSAVRDSEYRGVLPGHRLGNSLRFSRPEIDDLLLKSRLDGLCGRDIASPPIGPLINPAEAAAYLGLSRKALEHRLRRGQIPAYKVGAQWRFRAAELDLAVSGDTQSLTSDVKPAILNGETSVCRERR